MASVPTELASALSAVVRPGDFYTSVVTELLAPRLEVEGAGLIALPLLPIQVAQLVAVAERARPMDGARILWSTQQCIGPGRLNRVTCGSRARIGIARLRRSQLALKKAPHGAAAARDPLLAHGRNDLVQGQIRLLGNQTQQPVRVLLQRRNTASAGLCSGASSFVVALDPFYRRAGTQIEAFDRFPPRRTRFHCSDHTRTQIN